jgi:diguanylate cyclase (GGDEF)-like protein
MKMGFGDKEGALLHDLLEHATGDIVLRLNEHGFIDQGSEGLAALGLDIAQMLIAPHLADLTSGSHTGLIKRHFDAAMSSEDASGWVEFPTLHCEHRADCSNLECRRWFALNLRRLVDDTGAVNGALGLLRSVDRVRKLEDELFANALTDPLTGLVNRRVFLGRLRGELQDGTGGFLVLLAIDRMRALLMQYGQRTADEINWGFAKFLEAMALPGVELAQLDGERFAVILPGVTQEDARHWTDDLLKTFSSLALPSSGKSPRLTASAGITPLANSLDSTMREAELALIMARAGGGDQLALCGGAPASRTREGIANCNAVADALGDRKQHR